MAYDKNATRRDEIARTISFKERRIDELTEEKQRFERQLDEFRAETYDSFGESSLLYEKMAQAGNPRGNDEMATNQAIKRALDLMTDQNQEELERYYQARCQKLEDDIDQLVQEKGKLPWD